MHRGPRCDILALVAASAVATLLTGTREVCSVSLVGARPSPRAVCDMGTSEVSVEWFRLPQPKGAGGQWLPEVFLKPLRHTINHWAEAAAA